MYRPCCADLVGLADAPWDRCWPQIHAELADWAGRQVRLGKRGHVVAAQAAILQRLGL